MLSQMEQAQIERDALRAELEATAVTLEATQRELGRIKAELTWWVEAARRVPRTTWTQDF